MIAPAEIARLEAQGCTAENWQDVWVPEAFDAEYVEQVRFYGTVCLGAFNK